METLPVARWAVAVCCRTSRVYLKVCGFVRTLVELFIIFFKIGLFTFGGGYGMVALMEREIVTYKKWLEPQAFVDMLAVSQSAPGSIAVNGASFVGYKIRGFWGALAATVGVVAPSFLVILTFAMFLAGLRENPIAEGAFYGIRPAVVALILATVYQLARPIGLNLKTMVFALLSFGAIHLYSIHPIVILLLAAAVGILIGRVSRSPTESKAPTDISLQTEAPGDSEPLENGL